MIFDLVVSPLCSGEDLIMKQNAKQRGPQCLVRGRGDGISQAGAWVGGGAAKLVTFVLTRVAERPRWFGWYRCLWPLGLPPVSRPHSCLTRAKAPREAGASALEGLGRGPGRTWWVGCEGESAPPIVSLASESCHCEERSVQGMRE